MNGENREFYLPLGLVWDGKTYRRGRMRLATTLDELEMQDSDDAALNVRYRDIMLLARVIDDLDGLHPVTADMLENLFEADFLYLQFLYQTLNAGGEADLVTECPHCGKSGAVNVPLLFSDMELYKQKDEEVQDTPAGEA